MKYTIEGFSQKKLIELGLDCTDAVMIRYILDFYNSDKMCKVVVDGVEYFWLKYAYVIEQIPIIGIKSKDGLYRRMKKYAKCGLLIHHTHRVGGTYSCYRFNGPVLYQLGSNSDTSDEKSEGYGSEVGGGTDEKSEQKILLSEKINLSDNTDAVASGGGSASEHEQSKPRGEAPTTAGPSSARFKPPTVDEVAEYVSERESQGHPHIDAEQFVDWNQARGWMVGKNRMKDWKAAVRTWQGRRKEDSRQEIKSTL